MEPPPAAPAQPPVAKGDASSSSSESYLAVKKPAPAAPTIEPIEKQIEDSSSSSSSTSAPVEFAPKGSLGSAGSSDPVLGAVSIPEEAPRFAGKSLFLFAPDHPIRAFCIKVVSNRYFGWFISLTIIVNSVFLAINDPLKSDREGFNLNRIADYIFLVIFASEAAMKIVAMGFILHKRSYLRGAPLSATPAFENDPHWGTHTCYTRTCAFAVSLSSSPISVRPNSLTDNPAQTAGTGSTSSW